MSRPKHTRQRRPTDAPPAVPPASPEEPHLDIPFGEAGAAFLRNVLQHGVFLGVLMVILIILGKGR